MNTIGHKYFRFTIVLLLFGQVSLTQAGETVSAYELSYEEQEPGIDPYATQYIVSERYMRINDAADTDSFLLYDDKEKVIYSVNTMDRRTLVMRPVDYKKIDLKDLVETNYQLQVDAPKIAGKQVYRYQVHARGQDSAQCTDIQLAEGLLPQVTKILQNYKQIVAANLAKNLHKTPEEYKTTCFVVDQVFDAGEYFSKGLPILEWHSNSSKRSLLNYQKIEVNSDIFKRPEGYREFSMTDELPF